MRLFKWLAERNPEYQMLRERLTQMQDRVLVAERRVQILEDRLEAERDKLIVEKDKWAEYMAVINNRPPVTGVREWVDQNLIALRESQGRVAETQETLMRTVRQNQLAREKAKAEFEQQLPEFVEEKYKEAEQEREKYFKSADVATFLDNELGSLDARFANNELGFKVTEIENVAS